MVLAEGKACYYEFCTGSESHHSDIANNVRHILAGAPCSSTYRPNNYLKKTTDMQVQALKNLREISGVRIRRYTLFFFFLLHQ